MGRRRSEVAVVAVVLAAAAAASLLAAPGPQAVPSHDDAISILAAAGNLDDWEAATTGTMTGMTAGAWRAYVTVDGVPDPVDVAQGMGTWDLHPPLYPLVLGWWAAAFGTSLAALLALNAVLLGLTGAVVYATVGPLGMGRGRSIAAAMLVSLGPAALATGLEIRPYGLGLLLSAIVVALAAVPGPLGAGRAFGLGIVGTALMLTHYSGVWLLAGVALARLYLVAPRGARQWATSLAPVVAAPTAAVVLFPAVLDQVGRQSGQQRTAIGDVDLVARGTDVVVAVASYLVLGRPALVLGAAALLVGVAVVLLAVRWAPRVPAVAPGGRGPSDTARVGRALGVVAIVTLAGLCGAFLLGLTPDFAMAPKYLAFAAPPVAIALAAALPTRRAGLAGVAVVAVAVAASWSALTLVLPTVSVDPDGYDTVLVDSDSRGVVPRVVWHLPADTLVVVGTQDALVEYLREPGERTTCHLYVSSLRHGGTEAGQAAVVEALPDPVDALSAPFAAIGPAWQAACR